MLYCNLLCKYEFINRILLTIHCHCIFKKAVILLFHKISVKMDEYFFKKYNMKQCVIKLERLSKILLECTATSSEENEKLECTINRDDINTFSICVKRIIDIENVEPPCKKFKGIYCAVYKQYSFKYVLV